MIFLVLTLLFIPVYAANSDVEINVQGVWCGKNRIDSNVEKNFWKNYCKEGSSKFNSEGEGFGEELCKESKLEELTIEAYEKINCPSECPYKKPLGDYGVGEIGRPDANVISICGEGIIYGSYAFCSGSLLFLCDDKTTPGKFHPDTNRREIVKTGELEGDGYPADVDVVINGVNCGKNSIEAKIEEEHYTNYCTSDFRIFNPNKEGRKKAEELCKKGKVDKVALKEFEKINCPAVCPEKKLIQSVFPLLMCEEGIVFGSTLTCSSELDFSCDTKTKLSELSKTKEPEQPGSFTVEPPKIFEKIENPSSLFPSNPKFKTAEKNIPRVMKTESAKVFGAGSSDEFGQRESDSSNIDNWPEKAKDMCKKAQDNALKECQAAAYHPGGWYVDRTISARGTYKGKSINALISDQIVGQWDCPSHDLIVDGEGNLIEQAKIYSEFIDYTKMSREQKGGLPPDEEGLQITCHFACTAWPCPQMKKGPEGDGGSTGGGLSTPVPKIPKGPPGGSTNCEDHFFTDKDGDGKDDRTGRTKEQIANRTINGKPTTEGGEYAGMKYICEGEELSWWEFWKKPNCKLTNCNVQEIPLAGDPHTTVIRVCCDCSCGPLMVPPNFDPEDYEPLTTDPFEGLFEPEKPKTPPVAPQTDESCEENNGKIFFKAKDSKGKLSEGSVDKIMCDSFQGKDVVVNTFCVGNRFEATATPCKDGEKCENAQCVKQAVTQGLPKEGQLPNIFITDLELYPEAIVGNSVHVIITLGGDPLAIDTLTSSRAAEQLQINVMLNGQEVSFYCEIGRTGRIYDDKYQCSTDAKGLVKLGNNLEVQLLYQGQIIDSKTSTFQGKETSSITGYQTIDVFNNKNLACAINVKEFR